MFPRRLAALAAGLLLVAGCSKPPAPTTVARPNAVELAPVTYSDAAIPVRVPAVLARRAEAELSFKIRGVVAEVNVRAGDAVTAGQVLARLQLDEIDAQVAQARSALDKARRDLERVEKLQGSRVATFENLQDARTAVDVAEAQLRIAEFNRRFAVITAPAAGRILDRRTEPGELIDSGRAALVFAGDEEGWIARASLSDLDVARVRLDGPVEIGATAPGGTGGSGRITHISAAADPSTRTTPVEITLESVPSDARSGVVVSAVLHPPAVAPRPAVPLTALIEGADDWASLFVVAPGANIARRRRIEVESIDGELAYLHTPLEPELRLVVRGAEFLRDGATVDPAP